jgi:Zn-dependent protease with chaperone function
VKVAHAVLFPERHDCGACGRALFLGVDEPLEGMTSAAYLHSLDRRALLALDSIPGVPQLARYLLSKVGDRATRLLLMSSAVRCGEDQFPELLSLMDRARTRLDIKMRPELFLGESPHMNAVSIGFNRPMINVHSALLDQLGDDELIAVLGHELGHLHPSHHVYHALGQLVVLGGASAAGMAGALTFPFRVELLRWQRASELTADRAALLSCRDLRTCVKLMLTFAGGHRPGTHKRTAIQLAPFIRQARELARQQSSDWVDGVLAAWLTMDRSHPFTAWRVMHLIQWVEHGRYLDILAGSYPRRAPERLVARPRAALPRSTQVSSKARS